MIVPWHDTLIISRKLPYGLASKTALKSAYSMARMGPAWRRAHTHLSSTEMSLRGMRPACNRHWRAAEHGNTEHRMLSLLFIQVLIFPFKMWRTKPLTAYLVEMPCHRFWQKAAGAYDCLLLHKPVLI